MNTKLFILYNMTLNLSGGIMHHAKRWCLW